MPGLLSKFQMVQFQSWKGLSKANHLGSIFQSAPQKATNLMVQLLAFHRGKSLETFLSKFPVKEFDTDDEFTWDVIGSSRRNIPLLEARDITGNTNPESGYFGAGFETFYLVFQEDWFSKGEVIFGPYNETYPIRVIDDPKFEGTNVVYTCEVYGTNANGIPVDTLKTGDRFSVAFAPVERSFSRTVGDVRFSSPVSMRNEFSQIRIHTKVGGDMINKKLAIGIPVVKETPNGGLQKTTMNMWMHNVDYELECQFEDAKNNILAWGVSTRDSNGEYRNYGVSGEVIKSGSGLYEQMEAGNIQYYNKFSLKLLEDALYQISASKLDFKQRKFILRTGEYGAIQFHKAVLETTSGWTQFVLDNSSTRVIERTQNKLHSNALTAGFQFTEYKGPNGVIISVEVDPMYDDPVRNKILHPNGGVANSYRYDIFDMGSMEQPNIFKTAVKGMPEVRSYRWGLIANKHFYIS